MGVIDYGATEAGVIVMAIPCLVLFFLLQGYYVRGFMSGAREGMTGAARSSGRRRAIALGDARPWTGGLAILFLFPLLWSAIASVSAAAAARGRSSGFGLGNYVTLFDYGTAPPLYFLNSVRSRR